MSTKRGREKVKIKFQHSAARIRWSSPTQLLIDRSTGYGWKADGILIFQLPMAECTQEGFILNYIKYKTPLLNNS